MDVGNIRSHIVQQVSQRAGAVTVVGSCQSRAHAGEWVARPYLKRTRKIALKRARQISWFRQGEGIHLMAALSKKLRKLKLVSLFSAMGRIEAIN